MPTIFFDESGNTGPDLRNLEQKSFALASVYGKQDETMQLIHEEILKPSKTQEIKFKHIIKNGKRVTELLESLKRFKSELSVKICLFHKRYSIAARIVDLIVEPQFHDTGYNLYKGGANIAYTNALFYCIQTLCEDGAFEKLEELFVSMVRSKSQVDIKKYRKHINDMIRVASDDGIKARLKELNPKLKYIESCLEDVDGHSIDPAVTSFVTLCCAWGEEFPAFEVIHDQSKPMVRSKDLLNTFMDQTEPSVKLGFDNRKGIFPLRCTSLQFSDSKNVFGLQIADVFSGISTCFANRIINNNFDNVFKEIELFGIEDMIINKVWPSPKVTSEQLGIVDDDDDIDMVSYLTNKYAKKISKP